MRKSHEDQGLSEATSRPGLIAAGVSLAIIAAVNGLGTKLNAKFTSINASLH
ncbi:MAG: Flp family type IVb pilin [Bradyrhizobium sp.]